MDATSQQAYQEICGSKQMSARQRAVILALWHGGPQTRGEICQATGNPHDEKRLPELVRSGVVEVREPRECDVSGKSAGVYALSGHSGIVARDLAKAPSANRKVRGGAERPITATDPTLYAVTLGHEAVMFSSDKSEARKFARENGCCLLTCQPVKAIEYSRSGPSAVFQFENRPLFGD